MLDVISILKRKDEKDRCKKSSEVKRGRNYFPEIFVVIIIDEQQEK